MIWWGSAMCQVILGSTMAKAQYSLAHPHCQAFNNHPNLHHLHHLRICSRFKFADPICCKYTVIQRGPFTLTVWTCHLDCHNVITKIIIIGFIQYAPLLCSSSGLLILLFPAPRRYTCKRTRIFLLHKFGLFFKTSLEINVVTSPKEYNQDPNDPVLSKFKTRNVFSNKLTPGTLQNPPDRS